MTNRENRRQTGTQSGERVPRERGWGEGVERMTDRQAEGGIFNGHIPVEDKMPQ